MGEACFNLHTLYRPCVSWRFVVPTIFLITAKERRMKANMGSADRIIRILLAIVFAALYFTGTVTGTFGIVLLVLGGVFLATSLISFCPLYTLIGVNTCKK
jgi:Protein of unknown function (DUF2892)